MPGWLICGRRVVAEDACDAYLSKRRRRKFDSKLEYSCKACPIDDRAIYVYRKQRSQLCDRDPSGIDLLCSSLRSYPLVLRPFSNEDLTTTRRQESETSIQGISCEVAQKRLS